MGLTSEVSLVVNNQVMLKKFDNDEDIISRVQSDIDSVRRVFVDKIRTGERNNAFYNGYQWTLEQQEDHIKQMRIPFVYNEIAPMVNHLIGSQQSTRMDSRVVPREKGDEMAAQLLTMLVKWAEQTNQLEYIETQVFKSALIKGRGVAAVKWNMEDMLYGYPSIEYMNADDFVWDLNSNNPDLSDARWLVRVVKRTVLDMCERYPVFQEAIRKTSKRGMFNESAIRSNNREYTNGLNDDRDIIEHTEHMERIKINEYIVCDDIAGNENVFDNRNEAETFYQNLIANYAANNIPVYYDDFSPMVTFNTVTSNRILYTVIVGDVVVERKITSLSDFPYKFCFANYFEGNYQGFIDNLIFPQMAINRAWSQWDYSLGAAAKNPITVVPDLLSANGINRDEKMEKFRQEASRTNPIIAVASHDAIRMHQGASASPQLFQTITASVQRIQDYSGGKNVLGFTESAAESGRAVVARAEQGGVAKLPLFDALRQWRLSVIELVAWYIKNYMSSRQIARIKGVDENFEAPEVNDGVLKTIREMRLDVVIDEAVKSETMNERYFMQMREFVQQTQLPMEVAVPLLVEFSSLPVSKKNEIKSNVDAWKKAQEQQMAMQQQQDLQASVEKSITKKNLKDNILQSQGLTKDQQDLERTAKEIETKKANLEAQVQKLASNTMQNNNLQ